ncbi:uncharacterized protein LOC104908008 isoform X1 [Beta vulgaris subsp. vulgaris]|uniref:uncharacterized protein LOC104908008 isoform X1 n=1 Tax=Beta vulgaris subsp. vulgaris TaxID=3555 RepID=UPI000540232A|nr:uncharacterized protein LOC104908008 isoform X1 [Beta vulgaris subsp. vulgaris]XP_010695351.1 uncharacterized protein LOC104908008 isoform X1 [Beta vulgaris subsp. vulgaris]XP_048490949.1 uncharacterized protein LOC104908008 isoform X1 [Beta vulgaris subsp. vulgaris]XP_048490950.1 uncharacterized protein LOC104908008 isoform X1 [Beta vulgaris subsp. vulgaris]XP_057247237.1 uncharacterized protein LOC104908008 isoform X1 [Beta vulgaris subsp. vulgaris]XP_057247238.1 uncharacterized protein L
MEESLSGKRKNAPTSKALAEKAASKKRPSTTGDTPPPKKSKGFTAKNKKPSRPSLPKVVIFIPAEEDPPTTEERALVTYAGPVNPTLPLSSEQSDAVVHLDETGKQSAQPDAALDGSTLSGPVAKLVSQMPEAYRSTSRSSGESYYSNVVRTLRVGGRPMSPSNRQAVVIPVRNIDESPLSDKGKGAAEVGPDGSPTLSDDESLAAFARMNLADREKLKQELFKCFPEPYIKGLRGASSGPVGYMSQLAAELFARNMIIEDWARLLRKENKQLIREVTKAADLAQFPWSSRKCCTASPGRPGKSARLKWRSRTKGICSGRRSFWTRGLLWN